MKTSYINKKTLIKLINETEQTPYWMQRLVMKLYWSFQKHGETWMTLKDCWAYLYRISAIRYNPYQFPKEGDSGKYVPMHEQEDVKQFILV